MTTQSLEVAVVGAGLSGSMMACFLARAGHRVSVFERREDPRLHVVEGGRSINLALSHRGIRALKAIGQDETVLARSVPMRGRMMHAPDGSLSLQPYGVAPEDVIHSVSRSDLNAVLLDEAEAGGALVHFGAPVRDVNTGTGELTIEGASVPDAQFDLVVGADGAFSAVRGRLQRRSGFNYQQDYLSHGYKELSMPPTPDGDFALDAGALHIWPRGGFMMIALPNEDRSFTCTLFWPLQGEVSFGTVESDEDVERVFRTHFSDARPLFPDLLEQFHQNPVGSLVTIRCDPWTSDARVVLIGDAAHAVVPFYGQGMNASFEDCRLLAEALSSHTQVGEAIATFAADRKPDADAIADLALDNYITMRDRVASRGFLIRRALGRWAHRLFPRRFLPLYSMVTFSSLPYAQAVARWNAQVRTLRRLSIVLGLVIALSLLALLR